MLFILLNTSAVQEYVKDIAVKELKSQLGTELGIGHLRFLPFNSIELDSVYLYDQSNEKVLIADKVSAGIDLFSLLKKKVVITSAQLSDFEVVLSKENSEAPLNIQYIIDAFKSQDDKPKAKIDIKINTVSISNGDFLYEVKDQPEVYNRFDANHVHVSGLNAKLSLKSLASDSLNIQVKKLSMREKSGLKIENLTCKLVTQEKSASLRNFKLDLPSSSLEFEKCEIDLTAPNDTTKLLDYATIDLMIAQSQIAPKDIAPLVPAFQYFEDFVTLRAHITGSLNNIEVKDLSLDYSKRMHLVANAEIRDVRDAQKMYILGSIDQLVLSNNEVESLINNFSKNNVHLPSQLKNLGNLSFEGDISGYLSQLTAFGSLETDLGIINTDVLFGFNPKQGVASFVKGKIYTNTFDLGKFVENKDLNKASLNISVDMQKLTSGKVNGSADGNILNFDYKGYTYKDVVFDVNYDGMRVDGQLGIDDPNGKLNISGLFDFSDKKRPELVFKARVDNLQLDKLHIANDMTRSYLSFVIDANFTGKNIDQALGFLRIDSLDFIRDDKEFLMKRFLVEATVNDSLARKLKITSDILNGEVNGQYSFSSISNSILQTLQPYLPALITPKNKKRPDDKENNLAFNFTVNNSEKLSDILKLPVTVISPARIVGFYDNVRDKFKVEAFTPNIKAAGMNIQSGYVLAENLNDKINTQVDVLVVGKKNVTNDISIKSTAQNNLVNTHINLANDGIQKAKGEFSISTLFSKEGKSPLQIDIDMLPSELLLNNAQWKMDQSHINIKNSIIAVDNFQIYTADKTQGIKIDGKYSSKGSDEMLRADLRNINLEYIFNTLAIDVLRFGGAATGSLFVSTVENKPYANTRLEISDFKFNGTELGTLSLFSELDKETNQVVLDGKILSKESKKTKVNGTIDPVKQALSINFDADSLDISFLNRYAEAVFQNVSGRGSGNVHLFGNFSDVTVEGKAFIQNGNIGIKFLNTNYSFTDTVYMKKDLIYFNNMALIDQYNNKAIASGKVAHDFFHNFMYLVDFSASRFLVYNATQQVNPIFYGKVFGSGKGSVGGDERAVDIDINMRTENNTSVRMNFMEDFINEYSFITYKTKQETDSTSTKSKRLSPIKTESGMDINMNFYIDATPEAVVEMVMDPVGGDVLRGTGSGAMKFEWNSKSAPRLFGTYNINRGSYNFTFQRLLERRFTIEDGSNVLFRGDPFEATLNVKANYKVTASLRDLDRNLAESTGQTTMPVNCILNLTGPLKHPNVGLDIDFPSADAEVERQVKSLINTEDMINKQVAFLLLLSKFYTPDYADTQHRTSDFAAVASATLSNQLSKIVSQIDDRWELGTNIRYSDKEFTNTEIELILSSRLLNDRLLINGNFGYRNDININREALITDVDIEYLLNNAGSWRVKAFNHYNEKYYYTLKPSQTQGVGIIYKKDFDSLYELFRNPKLKVAKKDTIVPVVPDSAKKGSALSDFVKLKK